MFGFGEKPKAPSTEGEGQGKARSNENEWAEMVAGQKFAKPIISAEGMIEPKGISEESLRRGYEGNNPKFKEYAPELVFSEKPDKIEMLNSMRVRIEGFFGKSQEQNPKGPKIDNDELMAA